MYASHPNHLKMEKESFKCGHLSEKHFSKSLQNRSIYKDQCAKCFADPKSKSGILVCLTCFNSFCPQDHLKEHVTKRSMHCLYLRIEMFEKAAPETGHEITKLAIGVQGGALGGPEFETKYSLFCALCEQSTSGFGGLPGSLPATISSLIDCDSAYKAKSLAQWELSVQPCEHTLTLEQAPQLYSLQHCGECELSSNLWLCLGCGHIGCARKNYDGTGGNNHAIDHYNKTKHPLVVKSGTITAQGNASVHCYACDEEVVDRDLSLHLGVLGINVKDRKKTEKTIQELTLDINLTLALSRLVEEGRKMVSMYGPGYTGIDNIGNSCYLNSTLQMLFGLDEYRQLYYEKGLQHLKECNSLPSECFYCQVAKVADGLWSGKYSERLERTIVINKEERKEEYQQAIRPYDFKMLVAGDNADFKSSEQQDALEYLQHLFDKFSKEENKLHLPQNAKLFDFAHVNRLVCLSCNGYKEVEHVTNELKFPVPHPTAEQLEQYRAKLDSAPQSLQQSKANEEPEYDTTFENCLDLLAQGTTVEANCPKCAKLSVFRSIQLLKSTPKYLMTVSNRFVLEKWVPKKLNALIKIKEHWDVRPFLASNCKEGGELLKEAGAKPKYSEGNIAMLTDMGFSRNAAIRALSKNQDNVELACGWIYEHLDDKDLNDEFKESSQGAKAAAGPPQDLVNQIVDMGFTAEQAKAVLKKYSNNVELALGYLFDNGGDVSGLMEVEEAGPAPEGPLYDSYELYAVIVHLGRSVHSGHYVCYVKKAGKWVLFNDHKVSQTDEPVLEKGYIYLFKAK